MINYIIQGNFLVHTFISKNAIFLAFIVDNDYNREVLKGIENDKINIYSSIVDFWVLK